MSLPTRYRLVLFLFPHADFGLPWNSLSQDGCGILLGCSGIRGMFVLIEYLEMRRKYYRAAQGRRMRGSAFDAQGLKEGMEPK